MVLRNEKKIVHIDFPTYERQPVRWIRNNSYFYGSYYGKKNECCAIMNL